MQKKPLLADDPLDFIRRRIRERKIRWTFHVNMRMEGRYVTRESILYSIDSFEIIESNPHDKYLPSYLIYSEYEGIAFHVLIATDVAGDNVRIITSYFPDPDLWEEDLKTRRSKV